MTESKKPARKQGYWYFITIYYCPVCGRDQRFYEKRYDERPDAWHSRHDYIEEWDYCGI